MKTEKEARIVTDNYHGTIVEDPFRWLEEDGSPETKQWDEQQTAKTQEYFNAIPERKEIGRKLSQHWNYEKYFVPQKEGDYYYFQKNDGLQNQPVFYRAKTLTDPSPEVVIDPNKLNADGTTALTNISFNKDGNLLAYALSENGSDWQEIRIRNMETHAEYPETITRCKFSSLAWVEDGTGFYYSRYPDAGSVNPVDESNYNRLYFHVVGTDQTEDKLIHESLDDKELAFGAVVSDDYKYLILQSWRGTANKSQLYYRPIDSEDGFIPLADADDAYYSFIGNKGPIFYIYTNKDAANGKISAIDISKPEGENWTDVIPEQEGVMSFTKLIDEQFANVYLQDVKDHVQLYTLSGDVIGKLDLPEVITVTNVSVNKEQQEMFISYTSYLSPTTVARYDFNTKSLETVFSPEGALDRSVYETKQVFYPSSDGTEVPMFITHRKDLQLTRDTPVLLYGYGGFNISMTPAYSASNAMFIEDGGIYAVANIRGGGEYGEDWHQAGTFERKQQVFDDFIASAEWLIGNGYTNPSKLAIMGGSNGGLLVAACMNQRPDLFRVIICQVPVTDMLRYQHFTVGRFWTSEFGNAETDAEHFKTIYAYSPIHNIKDGQLYPATLITTGDTDDRVVPLHSKKYAAALQEAQAGDAPILLRIEKDAGHGLGKPTVKLIEEHTDIYTFLYEGLGMFS
ncbi:prolyl oligopeptidase family serine peptidase [Sporosarcina aquimarina]|uniref:prolyl oligopeptidase n=1 Tax=Sporosarcina aquimarina TaxID=114975 RepID=A0ABU4G170_9BACL|nr:prolyl oligopeptidase family serine peptidase [Sporosarcina aquimarina]MDW0110715.1 prolyl oligopeptidase family serine peptidase [Sporosarcina aquimarina]